jgi:hypothetical protein
MRLSAIAAIMFPFGWIKRRDGTRRVNSIDTGKIQPHAGVPRGLRHLKARE